MRNRIRRFIYRHDLRWKLQQLWTRTVGMRLAGWLEMRHNDWCWADICTNVGLGWDIAWLWNTTAEEKATSFRSLCDVNTAECSAKNGSCWCGKSMTPELRAELERDAREHKDVIYGEVNL